MIAVTAKAVSAIQHMTNTAVYPHAGVRIRKFDHDGFAVTIVPGPAHNDVTVPVPGANVYLDRSAAAALDHATLDAADNASRTEQLVLDDTKSW